MFVRYVLAVTLVIMCVGKPAQAQSGDGNELLRKCSAGVKAADGKPLTGQEIIDATWCAGYLHGLSDMHAILTAMGSQPLACFPEEVPLGEEARIVVKFLEAHPEWLRVEGRFLAVGALKETFACSSDESNLGISTPFKNPKIPAKPMLTQLAASISFCALLGVTVIAALISRP
jgi:Ssp1 endopeptidase immunity protein Rap1a